jgi:zinc transport system substrate-binding protein
LAVAKLVRDRPVVASHPVYEYWARRYSLNLKSVLWEPDVVPSAEAIEELKKMLDGHTAQVMIWEGTPAAESVEKLQSLGIASVVFDPCGNVPEKGDWLTTMQSSIISLRTWAEGK